MKKIFAILTIALAGAAFAQEDYLADDYIADVSGISEAESSSSVEESVSAVSSSSEDVVAETAAPEVHAAPVAESSSSEESYASTDYDTLFGTNTSGTAEQSEDDVMPAKSPFDDDSIPELKRCKYTFRSWGIGMSTWHNWRSEDHDRDWDLALLLHHARIWEMTSHGSITFEVNANFGYDEAFESQGIAVLGGRYFFLNDIYSPYVGAGLGLGLQYDGHLSESKSFIDKAAFGFGGNFEAGIVVFRTTTTQLDLGISYNVLLNVFAPDHIYGAFNFFLAINY